MLDKFNVNFNLVYHVTQFSFVSCCHGLQSHSRSMTAEPIPEADSEDKARLTSSASDSSMDNEAGKRLRKTGQQPSGEQASFAIGLDDDDHETDDDHMGGKGHYNRGQESEEERRRPAYSRQRSNLSQTSHDSGGKR